MKALSRKGRYRHVVAFTIEPHPRGPRFNPTYTLTLACGHKITRIWPEAAQRYMARHRRSAMCPVPDCQFPGFVDEGVGI